MEIGHRLQPKEKIVDAAGYIQATAFGMASKVKEASKEYVNTISGRVDDTMLTVAARVVTASGASAIAGLIGYKFTEDGRFLAAGIGLGIAGVMSARNAIDTSFYSETEEKPAND